MAARRRPAMHPDDPPEQPRRETLLTVMLTGLLACGVLFFLILVSGGFFFYVALAVAGIVALGFFHYMLWGYAMTQEVLDEQAREAAPGWTKQQRDGSSDNIQNRRF